MAYDKEFYERYFAYTTEPSVRKSHDKVFRLFAALAGHMRNVLDLGCGTGEYERHGDYGRYLGIDENDCGHVKSLLVGDYRKTGPDDLPFAPHVLLSLFSIEPFNPAGTRYAMYEELLQRFPNAEFILTSGFYYQSRRDHHIVTETGGISSYQSIEHPEEHRSPAFTELRLSVDTPSERFGPDVVEVWKILQRN